MSAASNIINIQDDTYYFTVYLVNSDNRVFLLRPDAIKQFVISDQFNEFSDDGYIIIDNKFDALEQPSASPALKGNLNSNGFIFKGNSRDVLRVEITPKLNYNGVDSELSNKADDFFKLSYEFIIFDVEEILGDNPGEKYKKLFLHDIFKEILLEKSIQFSTAEMTVPEISRLQYTGDILKYILNKTLNTEDNLNVKFESFDQGSTKIFFTAPTNFKVIDCIDYLTSHHISSKSNNYDQCFLSFDTYNKTWTFESLSQIFKKAYNTTTGIGGEYFLEKFLIGGYAGDTTDLNNFAVTIQRSPNLALYLPQFGTIDNFTLIPADGCANQLTATNRNVYNYNYTNSEFSIDSEQNDFTNSKVKFFENYVKPMKGQRDQPVSNIIDNKYKTMRQNISHNYSTYENQLQRLDIGRNIFMSNSVFLNSTISFRVKGATYRRSGKFIAIDRNNAIVDCDFDNKLLGIYLIVSVSHIFANNTYYNDLVCVKTYLYKDINSLPSPL